MRLRLKYWTYNTMLFLIGYVIGRVIMHQKLTGYLNVPYHSCLKQKRAKETWGLPPGARPNLDPSLLVGVMTTHRNLATRASAIYATWGKGVSGRLVFYVGQEGNASTPSIDGEEERMFDFSAVPSRTEPIRLINNLPVVTLQGISDEHYPPRDKCFAMIHHMHVNFAHDFQWVLRTDDDVYIRNDELTQFLTSVDNRKPWYIGHPGIGIPAERGRLGLGPGKQYCIGGPGVVFSPLTLRRLVPHLAECANSTVTYHEDTELGRCVWQHLNLSCTSSKEMQKLFYQDYSKDSYADPVSKKVFTALTMHPVKDPRVMHRLHVVFQTHRLQHLLKYEHQLAQKTREARELIRHVETSSKGEEHTANPQADGDPASMFSYNRRSDVEDFIKKKFDFKKQSQPQNPIKFAGQEDRDADAVVVAGTVNDGKSVAEEPDKESLVQEVIREDNPVWTYAIFKKKQFLTKPGTHHLRTNLMTAAIEELAAFTKRCDSTVLKPQSLRAQYQSELTLLHGVQHLVSVSRSQGSQFFLLSSKFEDLQWREIEQKTHQNKLSEQRVEQQPEDSVFKGAGGRRLEEEEVGDNFRIEPNFRAVPSSLWPRLSVLLALRGRHETYLRFLDHLTAAASRYPGGVNLRVALYPDQSGEYRLTLNASRQETPLNIKVTFKTTRYSRSNALNSIAKGFNKDAILIIVDVDLIVTSDFLRRVALNVSPGTAYFPAMFSKYAPETVCYGRPNCSVGLVDFSRDSGFWRHFSYGMLAIIVEDFERAGGFDSTIFGWGKEDVDFYERCLSKNIRVFRAPDVGLIHLYHNKDCDKSLPDDQLKMCQGSKHQLYGSSAKLSDIVSDIEEFM